jgi:hypothetical protein
VKQSFTSLEQTDRTKKLIQLKHQAYSRWTRSNRIMDKEDFYMSKVLLSNALRNERISQFNTMIVSLSNKKTYSSSVWTTNAVFTTNEHSNHAQPPSAIMIFHQKLERKRPTRCGILRERGVQPTSIFDKGVRLLIKQLENIFSGPDTIHN